MGFCSYCRRKLQYIYANYTYTGIIFVSVAEMIDNNRRDYCLACSWYAWTEQSLAAVHLPLSELF